MPDSPASIGWVCIIGASLAFGVNQIWEMVNRFRGEPPHPPNSQLEADARDIKRRVKALEEWKETLNDKLDADKNEILKAGREREVALKTEISGVAKRVDDLFDVVGQVPNQMVALLSNAKNLLGGGK